MLGICERFIKIFSETCLTTAASYICTGRVAPSSNLWEGRQQQGSEGWNGAYGPVGREGSPTPSVIGRTSTSTQLMQFPGEDAISTAAEETNLGPDEAEEVKG